MKERALYLTILLALTLLLIATVSCTKVSDGERISGTGTVRYITLEGGFYGIVGDDGRNYDPINLGKEFLKDGTRVFFQARIRNDLDSSHMWGTLIEIMNVELCST